MTTHPAIICRDGRTPTPYTTRTEIEGVRRSIDTYSSTHPTARLLATVDVLRAALDYFERDIVVRLDAVEQHIASTHADVEVAS